MTGFARSEGVALDGALSWSWEVRSVNGKGLDVRLRLPSGLEALEPAVRKGVAQHLTRGNVNLTLSATYTDESSAYQVNEAFLDALIDLSARKVAAHQNKVREASIDGLLAVKGVVEAADQDLKSEHDRAARSEALLSGLSSALSAVVDARAAEGAHLGALLNDQLDQIDALVVRATNLAAVQPSALKARLKAQVDALLESSPALSEERLTQEAALLAAKADIREELDRLIGHVAQGRDMLAKGGSCGRRLEFLSQEFNREANTLCAKSSDSDLTNLGLELKAVIDQFREQIQNVE